MDNDLIFTTNTYNQLNQAYNNTLQPEIQQCCFLLNNILLNIEIKSFAMDLQFQNTIINRLQQAKQILNILSKSNTISKFNIPNNPFSLLQELSNLSEKLTSYNIKSPFKTIQLKANNFIINSIAEISKYFARKIK